MKRIEGWNLCFAVICIFLILGVGTGTATGQTTSAEVYQQQNLEQELQEVFEKYPLVARAFSSLLLDHVPVAPCNLDYENFRADLEFCKASGQSERVCHREALARWCLPPKLAPPEPAGTPFSPCIEPVPAGTLVTSKSKVFTTAARSLLPACNLPAEFGRCGCTLNGLRTSCDIVSRCLEAGFCVKVASE